MTANNLTFQGTGDIAKTTWNSSSQLLHFFLSGRIVIVSPSILGTVRLRFSWNDPENGPTIKDLSLLSTLTGLFDFAFPIHSDPSAPISYQVDRLSLTGSVTWDFNVDMTLT